MREASAADAHACAAIYAPYVRDTAITFEFEPPSSTEMERRIALACANHAWCVVEQEGSVIGYAYGSELYPRAAYRWSCEVSVYVELGRRRTGVGRALYEALFAQLADRGFRRLVAGMTLPNEASEGLHRAFGFQPVGVYRQIGFKLGAWHDVAMVQRSLGDPRDPPPELR